MIRLSKMNRHGLVNLIDAMHVKRGVVIGTAKGHWSHYILRHSQLDLLVDVDYYRCSYRREEQLEAVVVLSQFGDRSEVVVASPTVVACTREDHFGFIYDVLAHREVILAWHHLLHATGGILAGTLKRSGRRYSRDVTKTVEDLSQELGVPAYVTGENNPSWFIIIGNRSNEDNTLADDTE